MSEQPKVAPGKKVTMHFSIGLEDGMVVESTREDNNPLTWIVGDGTLVPGFERVIEGMEAGESKLEILLPEEAFGYPDTGNIHPMSLEQFPADIELHEGVVVDFSAPNGDKIPGMIVEIKDGEVMVDFNHPLSGHTLSLKVEILAVEDEVLN